MKKKPLRYLQSDSTQTLREGVIELRAAEAADTDAAESFAPELKHDIDVHDAIHVLFACPTTLAGEIVAHVWTAFGTTASMRDMYRVNAHRDHRAVLALIGHWRLVRTWFTSFPRIIATLRRVRRMTRRWPVEEMSTFFDRRLCDIRRDFCIQLPSVPPSGTSDHGEGGAALRSIRTKFPGGKRGRESFLHTYRSAADSPVAATDPTRVFVRRLACPSGHVYGQRISDCSRPMRRQA